MPAAIEAVEARSFPATPDAIVEMDGWIEAIGALWEMDSRIVFRARVCVSELASNALEHGGIARDGVATVELRHLAPGIEITWSDTGAAFDPVTAPAVDPGPERVGGRGLNIVRAYARTISYRRDEDRNITTLRVGPATA